jgi:hypothetical protein
MLYIVSDQSHALEYCVCSDEKICSRYSDIVSSPVGMDGEILSVGG